MKNPSIMATSGRISNEKHVQGTPTVDKMYPTLQVCRTAFDLSPMFSHRHWVPARGMHFQTIRINDIIWWHTSFENPWLTTFGHLAAKVPMHNFHTALYIYIKIYRYTIYRYRYIMHRCTMYIYIYMCVIHFFRLLNLHLHMSQNSCTSDLVKYMSEVLDETPRDNSPQKHQHMVHYYTIYTCTCHLCSFPKFFDISNYWV